MSPNELRAIRAELDLTQVVTARLVGITERALQQFESGERSIPVPMQRLFRLLRKPSVRHALEDMASRNC